MLMAMVAIAGTALGDDPTAYAYGDAYADSSFGPSHGSSATNMQFTATADGVTGASRAQTYGDPASVASQTYGTISSGLAYAGTNAVAEAMFGDAMTYGYTNAHTFQPFSGGTAVSESNNAAYSWSGVGGSWQATAAISGTSTSTSTTAIPTYTTGMESSYTFSDGHHAIAQDNGQYQATTGDNTGIASSHANADSYGGNANVWGSMTAVSDDNSATANGWAQSHSDTYWGPADAYASGSAFATGDTSSFAQNENYADTYADIWSTNSHSYGFASATAS